MQLEELTRQDHHLRQLLHQANYFHQLDKKIKRLFPANLHDYFRVVCLSQGNLVVYVTSGMAASRLKMLLPSVLAQIQQLDEQVYNVQLKVMPQNPAPKRQKNFQLNQNVVARFAESAQKVKHHPELCAALENLVKHHRSS